MEEGGGAAASEEVQALLLRAVEGGTLETTEWGPEVTLTLQP